MKSIVLTGNQNLLKQHLPTPAPKEGEYLIKVHSVGVCNSDIFRGFAGGAYNYPLVMGHEISGEVTALGANVQKYTVGQKVVVFPLIPCGECGPCIDKQWVHCCNYDYYGSRRDGGFQEFLAVKEWNLIPFDNTLNSELACLCEPVAVCCRAVKMLPAGKKTDEVAIIGAGILGIVTAILLNKHHGYSNVFVIDRNNFKLELIKPLGINGIHFDEVTNYRNRFKYVIEASGAIQTYHASLEIAAPQATVVWLGNIQDDIQFEKHEISSILRKELIIRGSWNSEFQNGMDDDWSSALNLISQSPWLSKIVSHRIPLEELPNMLEQMYQIKKTGQSHDILKVVVNL